MHFSISFQIWIPGDEDGRIRSTEVNSVQRSSDIHCFAQFSRTIRELARIWDAAVAPQNFQSEHRLDGAHQHRLGDSGWTADRIHTKVQTVDEVDVAVSRRTEHDPIPRSGPAKTVASRILAEIRLGFDDWPAADPLGRAA